MALRADLFLRWALLAAAWAPVACGNPAAEASKCKTSAGCGPGEICLDGKCLISGLVPCIADEQCADSASICVAGYCHTVVTLDAGPLEDAAFDSGAEPDAFLGDGVIAVEGEVPLDFGHPVVGSPIWRGFTLRNRGRTNLRVHAVVLAPGSSPEFEVDSEATSGTTLSPGQAVAVAVSLLSSSGAAVSGLVEIRSDASACEPGCQDPSALRVALRSELKGARNLAVDPVSYDFAYQQPGTSSLYVPFVLSNQGTLDKTLTVSALRLEGLDVDQFALQADPAPLELEPDETAIVRVRYAPLANGIHRAELVLVSDSDHPQQQEIHVPLVGRAIPPSQLEGPAAIDFGEVLIGLHTERQAEIRNVGGEQATVAGAEFETGGGSFAWVSPLLPVDLARGEQVGLELSFSPDQEGAFADRLLLHDGDGAVALVIELTGTGVAPSQGYAAVRIEQSFTRLDAGSSDCLFEINHQNIDLEVTGDGRVCDKNAGTCGSWPETQCQCDLGQLGQARWSCTGCGPGMVGASEIVSNFQGENDGTFVVQAYYLDSCAAGYSGVSVDALQFICTQAGVREACFPQPIYPFLYPNDINISEGLCLEFAYVAAGSCQMTAGTWVRTRIELSQGTAADRVVHLCTPAEYEGQHYGVVRLLRSNGLFQLGTLYPATREVGAMESCAQ